MPGCVRYYLAGHTCTPTKVPSEDRPALPAFSSPIALPSPDASVDLASSILQPHVRSRLGRVLVEGPEGASPTHEEGSNGGRHSSHSPPGTTIESHSLPFTPVLALCARAALDQLRAPTSTLHAIPEVPAPLPVFTCPPPCHNTNTIPPTSHSFNLHSSLPFLSQHCYYPYHNRC